MDGVDGVHGMESDPVPAAHVHRCTFPVILNNKTYIAVSAYAIVVM